MGKAINLGSAKADDPIYDSGPQVHFKPPLIPSTSATAPSTAGALPPGKTPPVNAVPTTNGKKAKLR